jgi:hypothetical protein
MKSLRNKITSLLFLTDIRQDNVRIADEKMTLKIAPIIGNMRWNILMEMELQNETTKL